MRDQIETYPRTMPKNKEWLDFDFIMRSSMVEDIPRGINSGGTLRSIRRRWETVWAGKGVSSMALSLLPLDFKPGESMACSLVVTKG